MLLRFDLDKSVDLRGLRLLRDFRQPRVKDNLGAADSRVRRVRFMTDFGLCIALTLDLSECRVTTLHQLPLEDLNICFRF